MPNVKRSQLANSSKYRREPGDTLMEEALDVAPIDVETYTELATGEVIQVYKGRPIYRRGRCDGPDRVAWGGDLHLDPS